jgi:hypothetical protein
MQRLASFYWLELGLLDALLASRSWLARRGAIFAIYFPFISVPTQKENRKKYIQKENEKK